MGLLPQLLLSMSVFQAPGLVDPPPTPIPLPPVVQNPPLPPELRFSRTPGAVISAPVPEPVQQNPMPAQSVLAAPPLPVALPPVESPPQSSADLPQLGPAMMQPPQPLPQLGTPLPPTAPAVMPQLGPAMTQPTQPLPQLGTPLPPTTPARQQALQPTPNAQPSGPATLTQPVPVLPQLPTPSLPEQNPFLPKPISSTPQPEPAMPGFAPLVPRDKLQPEADLPPAPPAGIVPDVLRHVSSWPEVWGFGGVDLTAGNRMAPNGVPYTPIFDLQGEINFGLLPDKKLYIFFDMDFFGQSAGAAVTSPTQGSFDFSKREWDFSLGIAWNYWDSFEFRFSGFALNNLNRGISTASPYGFNDGIVFENRWYFSNADKYDVGKLSFLSIGYLPASDSLIGQDGMLFSPGMMARAYLTCDIPMLRSYLYFDGTYISDSGFAPRLLNYDSGVAVRPCPTMQNLEFRVGGAGTYDVHAQYDRSIGYAAIRFQF